jgi:hypothetical protein
MHLETHQVHGSDKKIGGTAVILLETTAGGLNFVTFLMLAHPTVSTISSTH